MKNWMLYLAAASMLALWALQPEPEKIKVPVTVHRGDTLYTICGRLALKYGDDRDIQEIIYYASKQNGLDGKKYIHPGDELVIEIEKRE